MLDDNVWLSLAGMLVAIVVVIGLAYWFTKHIVGSGLFRGSGAARNGQLKVLDQLRLGKDQQMALVQAAERYFLLGITAQGISLLAELTPEEASAWTKPPEAPGEETLPNFKQAFLNALQNRKQR